MLCWASMNARSLSTLAFPLLAAVLPGCLADFEPFGDLGSGSDCLEATDVVEIDLPAALADAKAPSPADATLDRWKVMPDSNAETLHLVIAACPDTRYSLWQRAILQAAVEGESSVEVRYNMGRDVGRTSGWEAGVLDAPGGEGSFGFDSGEGGDLELFLERQSPDLSPTPRLESLKVNVLCSDQSAEERAWEAEQAGESWDEGC